MGRLVIRGGRRLEGTVRISGAKNAVLKLMAASLMAEGPCVIRNVPDIGDVRTMIGLLEHLGARVTWNPEERELLIDASGGVSHEAPDEFVRKMRASIQVMGPLLGRLGRVTVSRPGGCAIGTRPIDFHIKGLRALGAAVMEERGYVVATSRKLGGGNVLLDYPSVGATENVMMAACLAQGTTVITNAAKEPEMIDTQTFLNLMGARVSGAGTDSIRIEGVASLGGAEHTVMPDRIEAGTYMVAAALSRGDLTVKHVVPHHLDAVVGKLTESGAELEVLPDSIRVRGKAPIRAVHWRSEPYPGFPTDMLPQAIALMAVADGTSVITENVHTNRFKHVDELRRMGAEVIVEGRSAVIKGVQRLTGARVEAVDLRAGSAVVLAGLVADGETVVSGVEHIERGYESLAGKLSEVGAEIRVERDVRAA